MQLNCMIYNTTNTSYKFEEKNRNKIIYSNHMLQPSQLQKYQNNIHYNQYNILYFNNHKVKHTHNMNDNYKNNLRFKIHLIQNRNYLKANSIHLRDNYLHINQMWYLSNKEINIIYMLKSFCILNNKLIQLYILRKHFLSNNSLIHRRYNYKVNNRIQDILQLEFSCISILPDSFSYQYTYL